MASNGSIEISSIISDSKSGLRIQSASARNNSSNNSVGDSILSTSNIDNGNINDNIIKNTQKDNSSHSSYDDSSEDLLGSLHNSLKKADDLGGLNIAKSDKDNSKIHLKNTNNNSILSSSLNKSDFTAKKSEREDRESYNNSKDDLDSSLDLGDSDNATNAITSSIKESGEHNLLSSTKSNSLESSATKSVNHFTNLSRTTGLSTTHNDMNANRSRDVSDNMGRSVTMGGTIQSSQDYAGTTIRNGGTIDSNYGFANNLTETGTMENTGDLLLDIIREANLNVHDLIQNNDDDKVVDPMLDNKVSEIDKTNRSNVSQKSKDYVSEIVSKSSIYEPNYPNRINSSNDNISHSPSILKRNKDHQLSDSGILSKSNISNNDIISKPVQSQVSHPRDAANLTGPKDTSRSVVLSKSDISEQSNKKEGSVNENISLIISDLSSSSEHVDDGQNVIKNGSGSKMTHDILPKKGKKGAKVILNLDNEIVSSAVNSSCLNDRMERSNTSSEKDVILSSFLDRSITESKHHVSRNSSNKSLEEDILSSFGTDLEDHVKKSSGKQNANNSNGLPLTTSSSSGSSSSVGNSKVTSGIKIKNGKIKLVSNHMIIRNDINEIGNYSSEEEGRNDARKNIGKNKKSSDSILSSDGFNFKGSEKSKEYSNASAESRVSVNDNAGDNGSGEDISSKKEKLKLDIDLSGFSDLLEESSSGPLIKPIVFNGTSKENKNSQDEKDTINIINVTEKLDATSSGHIEVDSNFVFSPNNDTNLHSSTTSGLPSSFLVDLNAQKSVNDTTRGEDNVNLTEASAEGIIIESSMINTQSSSEKSIPKHSIVKDSIANSKSKIDQTDDSGIVIEISEQRVSIGKSSVGQDSDFEDIDVVEEIISDKTTESIEGSVEIEDYQENKNQNTNTDDIIEKSIDIIDIRDSHSPDSFEGSVRSGSDVEFLFETNLSKKSDSNITFEDDFVSEDTNRTHINPNSTPIKGILKSPSRSRRYSPRTVPTNLTYNKACQFTIKDEVKKEEVLLERIEKVQLDMPPVKKYRKMRHHNHGPIFDPLWLSSAKPRDVNAAYKNLLSDTSFRAMILSQSVDTLISTRRLNEAKTIRKKSITLESVSKEIEEKVRKKKENEKRLRCRFDP